jgi:hypothetical protein
MGHIHDKNRKKPTDNEMQAAFQAFKQDFYQANSKNGPSQGD